MHAMRWRKSGRKWIAVNGHTKCEVDPPRDPNEPIQKYSWSVHTRSNTASGATSSLMESQQAAEKEAYQRRRYRPLWRSFASVRVNSSALFFKVDDYSTVVACRTVRIRWLSPF